MLLLRLWFWAPASATGVSCQRQVTSATKAGSIFDMSAASSTLRQHFRHDASIFDMPLLRLRFWDPLEATLRHDGNIFDVPLVWAGVMDSS
jgi:hypothetical protein